MEIPGYGKILQSGHRFLGDLYEGPVVIQEKVDGSQFSFGIIDGELCIRSKGATIYSESPEKMFKPAVDTVLSLKDKIIAGYIYRGETLRAPKHNVLAYDRAPKGNIILFDVERFEDEPGSYLSPEELAKEAERLNLECVPTFFIGEVLDKEFLLTFLEHTSILGGQKVEGIVIKNYNVISHDYKLCKGKIVSKDFQEVHKKGWKESNPSNTEKVQVLTESLRTKTRFNKAIIHLDEKGLLTNTPKDIGLLIKEVSKDIQEEEQEYIKEELYKMFIKDIIRGSTRGLPEWYKRKISGFDTEIDHVEE